MIYFSLAVFGLLSTVLAVEIHPDQSQSHEILPQNLAIRQGVPGTPSQEDTVDFLFPPPCARDTPTCWEPLWYEDCSTHKCADTGVIDCTDWIWTTDFPCLCDKIPRTCSNCTLDIKLVGWDKWVNGICNTSSSAPLTWNNSSWVEMTQSDCVDNQEGICVWTLLTEFQPPTCLTQNCQSWLNDWIECQITQLDKQYATYASTTLNEYNDTNEGWDWNGYQMVGPFLYLDRTCACDAASQTAITECASSCTGTTYGSSTQLSNWLNKACTFNDSVVDNSTVLPNAIYDPLNPLFPLANTTSNYPACGSTQCISNLEASHLEFQQTRDLKTPIIIAQPGGKYSMEEFVNVTYLVDWCPLLSWPTGTMCNDSCYLTWQRPEMLLWLNETCAPVVEAGIPWSGLPANWTNLLHVQYKELIPWSWNVTSSIEEAQVTCPKAESQLTAFAGINLLLFLLTPIFGRRTVVYLFTCRLCGKKDSSGWKSVGLGVGFAVLHLVINFVNAFIVSKAPGYGDTSVSPLAFLWCARPRLSWFAIVLVVIGPNDVLYLSCAISSLTVEIILQLFSASTFGFVANYARIQHFYYADGRLLGIEHGKDALLMYAGALIWLCSIPFALVALATAISTIVGAQAARLRTWFREREGKHKGKCLNLKGSIQKQTLQRIRIPYTPAIGCTWEGTRTSLPIRREASALAQDKIRSGYYSKRNKAIEGRNIKDPLKDALEHQQQVLNNLIALLSTMNYYRTIRFRNYKRETKREQKKAKKIRRREQRRSKPHARPLLGSYTAVPTTSPLSDSNSSNNKRATSQAFSVVPPSNACLEQRRENLLNAVQQAIHTAREELADVSRAIAGLKALTIPDPVALNQQQGLDFAVQHRQHEFEVRDSVVGSWQKIASQLEIAIKRWTYIEEQWKLEFGSDRAAELSFQVGFSPEQELNMSPELIRGLKRSIPFTMIGMLGCWVAQWIWWIGYVRLMGDLFVA